MTVTQYYRSSHYFEKKKKKHEVINLVTSFHFQSHCGIRSSCFLSSMNLTLLSSILQPEEETEDCYSFSSTRGRVHAVCFSADNRRLAVSTGDRIISLYDKNGVKVDKFTTKPNVNGVKDYFVRSIQFNSDTSQPKLAVAQSDNILFVYKWAWNVGMDSPSESHKINNSNSSTKTEDRRSDVWSGKKTICNKFLENSSVTCLAWPPRRLSEVIYGLEDGTVKVGILRTNTSNTLHKHDYTVIAIAPKLDGNGVATAHLDGSIFVINFLTAGSRDINGQVTFLSQHPCPAYAISWGRSLCVAGNDELIVFYDEKGVVQQRIDYSVKTEESASKRPYCKEFSCATCNSTGDAMIFGNFNWFVVYTWDKYQKLWREDYHTVIENMHTVSCVAWNTDCSMVAIGSSAGLLDIYSSFLYKCSHKNTFDIICITPSYLTITAADDETSPDQVCAIRSKTGGEILKLQFFSDFQQGKDRYVVAKTKESLIVCDTENPNAISEIPRANNKGVQKFIFSFSNAFIICEDGEFTILEYGKNELLASFCCEFISENVISLVISGENVKKVAYPLDAHTICVKNMATLSGTLLVNHMHSIDFVEFNYKADLLLFRDERKILYVVDLETQMKNALMDDCSYAQWVPNCNVVVSQRRSTLFVHYNIKELHDKSETEIRGNVVGIERYPDRTIVIVSEGLTVRSHTLIQELIDFSWAIEVKDVCIATDLLEKMCGIFPSQKIEHLWGQLYDVCIDLREFKKAERCAAALGNVSLMRYIRSIEKVLIAGKEMGVSVEENWRAKGKLHALTSQLIKAEETYLAYGKIDEVFAMYENLHLYEESIRVARRTSHPDLDLKKKAYMKWLLETNQEELAALQKESERDFSGAVNLYLTARLPGMAFSVIIKNNVLQPVSMLESVAFALEEAQMHDKAGEIFQRIGSKQKAMKCYLGQNDYQNAVRLARTDFPEQVVSLEERWANYLVSANRSEEAIPHFIEAQLNVHALKVALEAKCWTKAEDLLTSVTDSEASPFFIHFAKYYEQMKNLKQAEHYYVKAQRYDDMVLMYLNANMLEKGHAVAKLYLTRSKLVAMYTKIASIKEQEGNLDDAENIYLTMNEPKWAVNMHKKHRQFRKMIDLVMNFFPDQVEETHMYIGNQLKSSGELKEAEYHFIKAGEGSQAVLMYHEKGMLDDALRVATQYGNESTRKKLAYDYAAQLGFNSKAIATLSKLDFLNPAIEQAVELFRFEDALRLSEGYPPGKVQDLHLHYAMHLEDEDKFPEAEDEFLKAQRPMEAIDMYMHLRQWDDAVRIATKFEPTYVQEIYLSQAQELMDTKAHDKAAEMFVRSGRPELALQMYQGASMFQDAVKFAEKHLPRSVAGLPSTLITPSVAPPLNTIQDSSTITYKDIGRGTSSFAPLDVVASSLLIASVDSGDWETLWNKVLLGDVPAKTASAFVMDRVRILMHSSEWNQAKRALLALLLHHSESKVVESLELYHDLARLILSLTSNAEKQMDYLKLVTDLRRVLFKAHYNLRCHQQLVTSNSRSDALVSVDGLERLLLVVHYACMCAMCAEKDLNDIAAKCAIRLLHCETLIPGDKRYFLAGQYCRRLENGTNLAFILLNRYVDIIEAMEEGDLSNFMSSMGNLPVENILPEEHYLSNEKDRADIKDWILTLCVDSTISKTLPDRKQAVSTLYEGLYSWNNSNEIKGTCIITGYPIRDSSKMAKRESYVADRATFEAFIAKVGIDPWTLDNPNI